MADDRTDPIANTAAFRAFSAEGPAEPARRRPGALVYLTAVLVLAALAVGVLAFAL